jgi:hypothetical protein
MKKDFQFGEIQQRENCGHIVKVIRSGNLIGYVCDRKAQHRGCHKQRLTDSAGINSMEVRWWE